MRGMRGRDGRGVAVIRFFRIRTKNRTTLKRDLTNRLLVLFKKRRNERKKETKIEKEEGKRGEKRGD